MTESAPSASSSARDENIEDAVVVDEATGTPVVVEEAAPSATEPVVATADPAAAETEAPATATAEHRVVYVQVPPVPRKLGNRGIGSLIAVVAAIVFTGLFAVIYALIAYANTGVLSFAFLGRTEFYIPTLFFLIGFVLLVLIVNRASWWVFIIGSLIVGVFVYFGSIGLTLLGAGIVSSTPDEAARSFSDALRAPFFIVAALLAREVALWTGAIIARRGRRVRARNIENREAYDRELAATRAEHERAAAPATA